MEDCVHLKWRLETRTETKRKVLGEKVEYHTAKPTPSNPEPCTKVHYRPIYGEEVTYSYVVAICEDCGAEAVLTDIEAILKK